MSSLSSTSPRIDAVTETIDSVKETIERVYNPRTDWKQLIILGNGFDLQCGLHSRFGDFFQPRFERIEQAADPNVIVWRESIRSSNIALWDFILEANIDSPWCDVEGAIERWVLATEDIAGALPLDALLTATHSRSALEENYGYDPSFAAKTGVRRALANIARYLRYVHPDVLADRLDRNQLLKIFKEELHKLEEAFKAYLRSEVENNANYADRCQDLFTRIAEDGKKSGDGYRSSTSVLSFNYTTQVRQCSNPDEDGVCVNIHGTLDDNDEIIFGIDGKECMDNPEAVAFTKTFRLMQRGGSLTDKLIGTANSSNLEGATDLIKFYGHSLGRADYSYFQSIFDGVDLYESKTALVFYYPYDQSEGAEEKNKRELNSLANKINNLLVAYGATLENKDHGKNLIHKLLLEGRLRIKGLG